MGGVSETKGVALKLLFAILLIAMSASAAEPRVAVGRILDEELERISPEAIERTRKHQQELREEAQRRAVAAEAKVISLKDELAGAQAKITAAATSLDTAKVKAEQDAVEKQKLKDALAAQAVKLAKKDTAILRLGIALAVSVIANAALGYLLFKP